MGLQDYFVAPVIQERKQKRVPMTDAKQIFLMIDKEHQFLSYEQSVELLNDLAYIIIPFDKTYREF